LRSLDCEQRRFKALLDSRLVRNRCRVANGGVAIEPKHDTGPAALAEDRFIQSHAHARIPDPKPPRNQTPKPDSSKASKRRFSQI
jgi:hypothetical protein